MNHTGHVLNIKCDIEEEKWIIFSLTLNPESTLFSFLPLKTLKCKYFIRSGSRVKE